MSITNFTDFAAFMAGGNDGGEHRDPSTMTEADWRAAAVAHPSRISGGCLCGAVRYELAGCPVNRLVCHCTSCRKASGSMFMTNGFWMKEQVTVTAGESSLGQYFDTSTASGHALERRFCSSCGSPLFLLSEQNPNLKGIVVVTVGSMDVDHQQFEKVSWQPDLEVFCGQRRRWLPEFEGTIKHEGGRKKKI